MRPLPTPFVLSACLGRQSKGAVLPLEEQDFDKLSPNGERGSPYSRAGTAAFIASLNQAQARLSARVIVSPRNCASSSR
jgi:hypothetical protein